LIVERTRSAACAKRGTDSRRHAQEPQDRSQQEILVGPIHGAQDPRLNHPNIAAIYGIEESGDVSALVMELVEGEALSQRIARGAIRLDETLPLARQIADAVVTET
jgi:serine/threonine protein kinase